MQYRLSLLLVTICFCSVFKASAQQYTIKGVVSKKSSPERVAGVVVKDLKTNTQILSDDVGWFTINTAVGDTLLFTKEDYTPQKVVVLNNSDMPIYLQPIIKLDEVKVLGQTKKQELNEVLGDYKKQGTFYGGSPPVLSFLTNPLTGIYELFGKTPGRARRFKNFARGEAEQAEIIRRYNVAFVREYTKLPTDSAAQKFMDYYTPTFEDLKGWTNYDLIQHTLKAYDYYSKSPDKARLEKLNAPTFIKSDSSLKLSQPGESLKGLKKEKRLN